MKKSVQLFVPKFRVEECVDELRICLEQGWTGLGFKTNEFEEKWCEYSGLPYAHFLNSATAGLHLALHIFKTELSWTDGDEVVTSPITFVSTNHSIVHAGLKPVFADVDDNLCLTAETIAAKLSEKTKAVIFVGIGGNQGDYKNVKRLCEERSLILILDAAHMAGTRSEGRHVGADADCSVFSFQAVKNLPTADSGMICFRDRERDIRARKLSWLGIDKDTYQRSTTGGAYKWRYSVEECGFKYHGNSIMAAMGLISLKYLDIDNSYRRQLSNWYTKNFHNESQLQIIDHINSSESSRHLFQVRIKERDQVILALNKQGIFPGVHYIDNTQYTPFAYARGSCPNAAKISKEILSLPLHMNMSFNDLNFVASELLSILKDLDSGGGQG